MNGIWKEIWQILLAIKFENKEKYEKKYAPGEVRTADRLIYNPLALPTELLWNW